MAIDDKPTAAWDESDLQELCDERRRESPRLEFKREVNLERPSRRDDIEHDVAALANAGGGHLIVGIGEEELPDGSKVAGHLTPIADGGLYEQLNNLLDGRGDPKVPFEIYAIPAAVDGIYIVVEVHGNRQPHMANDGRYYLRRNLLVRAMTEAEVADAYRQRFVRERRALALEPVPNDGQGVEGRIKDGLNEAELAQYQEETGDPNPPGWLTVWCHPVPLQPNLVDPRHHDAAEFQGLQLNGLWREAPLRYFNLQKTNAFFVAQLPPGDDAYPAYFTRIWPDGLLEWGDLQAPVIRREQPEENRLIATRAVAEYVHDFLVFAKEAYAQLGWGGEAEAKAKLSGVRGYRLAVEPGTYFRGDLVVREDGVESLGWRGPCDQLDVGATEVARDLSDRIFIAGGVENGAYFFNADGAYTGRG